MKKLLLFLTAISVFLYACKETTTVTPKSLDKQILTFKINNVTEESNTVDQTSRNIRIVVPAKTDRKALTPSITLSPKATVSPANGVAQDFTSPVKYTVTAEDGTSQIYTVVVDVKMSSEKVISAFTFSGLKPEVKATIAGTNIDATIPSGTDLKTLVPTIMLSAGATVSPESNKAQDFTTSPVKYTVTAEDGTKQDYLVKITVAKSTEKQITEFRLAGLNPDVLGTIDQTANTISATVPAGTNLKTLIPTLKLSALATVTPASGTAQDFTNTVNYTVKAEDGSTQVYKVTIAVATINTNKYAYVGCNYNYVFCLDAKTGSTKWKVQLATNNLPIDSSPTYANGIVYVSVNSISTLFALDAETGAKKWQVKLNGGLQSSPTVLNSVVYIGSGFNTFYALDALTGAEKWTYSQGDFSATHVTSSVVSDGIVYMPGNGKMIALDAATGKEKWTFAMKGIISIAVVDGVVYLAGDKVYALEAKTGTKKWELAVDNGDYGTFSQSSAPTIANGVLYVGNYFNKFYAINASTGKTIWTTDADTWVISSPFVSGDIVYFSSFSSNVYALNVKNGNVIWKDKIGSEVTVASNVLFAGQSAYNATTGALLWKNSDSDLWVFKSGYCIVTTTGTAITSGKSGNQQ